VISDGLVPWLRRQAEGDLAAARIISAGGFAPQWWDTSPPGQVNPEAHPASGAVTAVIGQEPESSCGWVPLWVRDQVLGEPPDDYASGVAVLAKLGRREFDHVRRHDPRNEAARAESVLMLLDLYGRQCGRIGENAMEEDRAWTLGTVVSMLAAGYRHREGWKEEWGG
jgi:hypothetical protein